eukprot:7140153-Pyramimonas_sp.AAC.1
MQDGCKGFQKDELLMRGSASSRGTVKLGHPKRGLGVRVHAAARQATVAAAKTVTESITVTVNRPLGMALAEDRTGAVFVEELVE